MNSPSNTNPNHNALLSEEATLLSKTAANASLNDGSPEAFETLEQWRESLRLDAPRGPADRPQTEGEGRRDRNLQSGRELTPEETAAIRALIVGDAEHYLALENNFDDWAAELERITSQIAQTAESADEQNLANLRGMLKDATRLVPTMRAYAEEKRRVEHFDREIRVRSTAPIVTCCCRSCAKCSTHPTANAVGARPSR